MPFGVGGILDRNNSRRNGGDVAIREDRKHEIFVLCTIRRHKAGHPRPVMMLETGDQEKCLKVWLPEEPARLPLRERWALIRTRTGAVCVK